MSAPNTDPDELAVVLAMARWAWWAVDPWPGWSPRQASYRDECRAVAEAVRDAVCPADHVVVPKAALQTLLDAIGRARIRAAAPQTVMPDIDWESIGDTESALRLVLRQEP